MVKSDKKIPMHCIRILFDVGAEGLKLTFRPLLQIKSCALRARFFVFKKTEINFPFFENKKSRCIASGFCLMWALRDSNPRPLGCKPSALNQLS